MNEKEQQFIIEVQTAIIIDCLRKDKSATIALINMDDAFFAAKRIPENLSAHEAACQFVEFAITDKSIQPWFTRP